jgi:hypothetical protein
MRSPRIVDARDSVTPQAVTNVSLLLLDETAAKVDKT